MTPDEQSIQEIVQQLEAAWNASDSKAWAAHFAEDASFIHIFGGQLDGRVAIEGSHRVIFDTIYKGSRNQITIRGMRLLKEDVAVIWAAARLQTAPGNPMGELESRPTMVMVKDEGKWQIVAFQNTRITEMPAAAEAAARLAR